MKLRLLRDVYRDYKELQAPKAGFWSRLPIQRFRSVGMPLPAPPGVYTRPNAAEGSLSLAPLLPQPSAVLGHSQESAPAGQSRRQRLLGLARATRDMYIPKLSSMAQLATSGVLRSPPLEFDEFGLPISFPAGTVLTIFPSFTRPVSVDTPGKAGYLVGIRGWMWCPGLMSRKNRLVLSLAKQLTKSGSADDVSLRAIDRYNQDSVSLDPDVSDQESLASSTMLNSADPSTLDKLIKERLGLFIAQSIGKASLRVVVGSESADNPGKLVETKLFTDGRGHFQAEIFVKYKPSLVLVNATAEDSIYAFLEVKIAKPDGLGIISDIDDTVKHTGVIGDKRELMNRLLTGHLSSWNIPVVVRWYQDILALTGATFHYVSNSPWQLFNLIHQYFETVKLPLGSIHLKQYSGNIVASLREPSSSRKGKTLVKILEDYPQKKFLCVGDSGEHDFDAYVALAKAYPNRIMAIYIRVVLGSFSLLNDHDILKKLQRMTAEWKRRRRIRAVRQAAVPVANTLDLHLNVASPNAVSRSQKLPPLVPKKPPSLKSQAVQVAPAIPVRKSRPSGDGAKSIMRGLSPERRPRTPLPRPREVFNSLENEATAFDNLNTLYGVNDKFELEDVDEKGALWIQKLVVALHDLEHTQTDVRFFEDDDEAFFQATLVQFGALSSGRSASGLPRP